MAEANEARVELHERWLRVYFGGTGDGPRHADFHYLWLRHNCDQDRHPLTNERIVDSVEIDPDVRPVKATAASDRNALFVHWGAQPEDRVSRYSLDWLRAHAYAPNEADVPPPPSDADALTLDAKAFASETALAGALFGLLRTRGLVVVRGYKPAGAVAPEDTEKLVDLFARSGFEIIGTHFGRIEDLRTDNTTNQNTDQLGYTDAKVDLHTDQPFLEKPPRFQLLHCITAAPEGGDNAVVDALAAARYLTHTDAEADRTLRAVPVHFHRKQKSFEKLLVSPILSGHDERDFQIRYSYFTMAPYRRPFNEMESWYRAYNRFAALVRNPAHQYRVRLEAGDFLAYDNHRMLHARTAFRGARWLRGVYFDPLRAMAATG
jgi:alpha-ketoglutarate-dependent taurine dioxygenase